MEPKDRPYLWAFVVILVAVIGGYCLIEAAKIQAGKGNPAPNKPDAPLPDQPPGDFMRPRDDIAPERPEAPKSDQIANPIRIEEVKIESDRVNGKSLVNGGSAGEERARCLLVIGNESPDPQTIKEIRLEVRGFFQSKIASSTMAAFRAKYDPPPRKIVIAENKPNSQIIDRTPMELSRGHSVSIPYRFSLKSHPTNTVVTLHCNLIVRLKNGFEASSEGFELELHPDSPLESDEPIPAPSS